MNKAMKPSCIAKLCVGAAVCALNVGAADFLVRAYGAKGDGATFDTEAVQKAIDACAADGGGRVVLEKGVFLVKPIMLKSGVDLHIARNARLSGLPYGFNRADAYPEGKLAFNCLSTGTMPGRSGRRESAPCPVSSWHRDPAVASYAAQVCP